MNDKLTTLIISIVSMLTFVLAQDPQDRHGAPNQGTIPGMGWLAMSGLILAAKKYLSNNK